MQRRVDDRTIEQQRVPSADVYSNAGQVRVELQPRTPAQRPVASCLFQIEKISGFRTVRLTFRFHFSSFIGLAIARPLARAFYAPSRTHGRPKRRLPRTRKAQSAISFSSVKGQERPYAAHHLRADARASPHKTHPATDSEVRTTPIGSPKFENAEMVHGPASTLSMRHLRQVSCAAACKQRVASRARARFPRIDLGGSNTSVGRSTLPSTRSGLRALATSSNRLRSSSFAVPLIERLAISRSTPNSRPFSRREGR